MELFRRFFYRKPQDGLLKISDRVYGTYNLLPSVFECCLSSKVPEEDEYEIYMGGLVAGLQDYYPDSSFLVLNFREGDKRTQFADMLCQYDMTVMEYPQQYEGCRVLPLGLIHHFLRISESWLSLAGQKNVLLMHCERGGWPVLAFMLAALLLFQKQYNGEQKTLEMVYKQAPRELLHLLTPLNPQPSQLRYLQYISRRNSGADWPSSDTPLALDCIIFREECELVRIDIHDCLIQGDVVLECVHLDEGNEETMFRVMFHTTFVRANILMLSRDEVDVMWDAKGLNPVNFSAEIATSPRPAKQNTVSRYGSPSSHPSPPSTYAAPYSSPQPQLPPPPPPPRHGFASPPSPRHSTPSPVSSPTPLTYGAISPPPPPPSAPDYDVSALDTLFSAVVPKKDSSIGGGQRKHTGSKTEKVHTVLLSDADSLHESQKFWDEFWLKVDARFIEEKPSKPCSVCGFSCDRSVLQEWWLCKELKCADQLQLLWGSADYDASVDMALFRRFFLEKPPDGLLEISERIYVFDCCLSTEALEEDKYYDYVDGIVAELQNYHADSTFMVFNFGEGNTRTRISCIMHKHNMTVMHYPRQYEGCPMLPLEMIHHFLRFSDSWMSLAGQQNVLLMHCERGGWPVIAFVLAALLLFRKQYKGEQKTLEMINKQAPRELHKLLTPLNPQPSQLRYLQYISRRKLGSEWPRSDTLALDYIILRVLPTYGEKGCRPAVRLYGQQSSSKAANRSSKLLFASSKTKNRLATINR
ncbi:hypothetical protein OSB04_003370 [Centaurea solstitialis]|uniref:C2 tensin-type domain-containing protein n=1 Tax=Centaurea solstitialis TaxID=347529 RepID=A0AA38TV07_9ASTR|nr:hypothetical protein OSB04_003370 [Centaurea solstitialis]